ncbi:MAG: tetratricopeptide repeat protein [Planctomycetaceae bacterium]|nr:tetratricopeptide repeat protein [Planctomycetaceae bacterium]
MANATSFQPSQSTFPMSESSAQDASTLSVSENLHLAMQAIKGEEFSKALLSLNRAIIDADPFQLAECYALRGFVRLRMEQFEQAEEDCSQSIRRRGDDPETLTWRAAARAEREDWRGAFSDLDRARYADPGQSGIYAKTMKSYLPAALTTFENRLQLGRRMAQAYYDRGSVYLFSREIAEARADFKSTIEHDAEFGPAYVGLAKVALRESDYLESIRLAGHALQLSEKVVNEALAVRAEAYANNGQLALAVDDVVRLREKVGDRVDGLIECGRLRHRLGDLAGAIEDLNLAHQMNPELPVVLALRGAVFAEMRNYQMALRDFSRYLSRVPGDEKSWLQLGELHLRLGDPEEARIAFDRALELDELCVPAYIGRCKVMMALSNHAQGLIESERAIRLDARSADTFMLRGKIFHKQGRHAQANAEFDKALQMCETDPTRGELHYLRGVSRFEAGNPVQAIDDFKAAGKLRPTHAGTHIWRAATSAQLEDWPDVIENLHVALRLRPSAAKQYRKLGTPVAERAIKHFDRMIREGKPTPELLRNRGRAYQFLGKTELAINDFNVTLNSGSEDYETMIECARLIASEGQLDDAVRDLSKVIKKTPGNAAAYFARAEALMAGQRNEAALRDIRRAIELDPSRSRYHVLLGDLKLLEQNAEAATDHYSQAVVLDPADHLAFRKRGSCYQKLQQYLYAIADLTRSDELLGNLPETYVLRGNAYLKSGQLEEASADFEKALKIDAQQVKAYVGRANYLSQVERYEEGLMLLTKVMQRFEDDDREIAELLMMRGKIFYQMGRFPPALTDFTNVIELCRKDKFSVAAARCARGVVLVQHGDLIRAKKQFDRVLRRFPEHPVATQAAQWLTDGQGDRPEILLPPDRMIRPTRPLVIAEPREIGATDAKWDAASPFDLWIVRTKNRREYGPVTKMMLDDWVRQGRIAERTRLLRCGWPKWRKAYRVYEELLTEATKEKLRKRAARKKSEQ